MHTFPLYLAGAAVAITLLADSAIANAAPELERIIAWDGQHLDTVRGLAAGPDGTLFVVSGGNLYAHRQTTQITALDRTGAYIHQVFPASRRVEDKSGWPHIASPGGPVPVIHHGLTRCPYPGAVFGNRALPAVTRDGRWLITLSGPPMGSTVKHTDQRGGRRLLVLGTNGDVPKHHLGPVVAPETYGGFGRLAISPDQRSVFVTGLFDPTQGLCNKVWKVALDGSGKQDFLTDLSDPQGLDFDASGNLHVAEYGADWISVFSPAGKRVATIPVKHPDSVAVAKKSGAVYVLTLHERTKRFDHQHYHVASHNWKPDRLVKFVGGRETACADGLLKTNFGGGAFLALDESSERHVLWLGGCHYGGGPLYRAVDNGTGFEFTELLAADHAIPFIGNLAVAGDRVIVRHPAFRATMSASSMAFDGRTGERLPDFIPKTAEGKPENYWQLVYGETISGKDGRIYVHAKDTIRRYEADGKPAPFASTGSHVLEGFLIDRHTNVASMFVDHEGSILVGVNPAGKHQLGDSETLVIMKIGADGRLINDRLVTVEAANVAGIAADSKGNIYLGTQVSPPGERIPAWCRDQLPTDTAHGHPQSFYAQVGSIVKFPPTGGWIRRSDDGPLLAHRQQTNRVVTNGKLIARGGLAPGKVGQSGLGCACEVSRFDIDGHDRLFVPDIHQFCVRVLDTDGRELTRFGSYGNMDDRGPEITFGWPLAVRVSGNRAYVADLTNRRVVSVRINQPGT